MFAYTFECKNTYGCPDDFGSTHFTVIADSKKEAWKKAMKIEERENIIKIWMVKAL